MNDLDQYLKQLKSLGFEFSDTRTTGHSKAKLEHYIPTIGIPRFNDYAHPFTKIATLEDPIGSDNIIRLYRFDRKLRLLTLDAVERVEVALKSQLDHALNDWLGDKWHLNKRMLNGFAKGLYDNIHQEVSRTDLMKRIASKGGGYKDFPSNRVLDNVSYGRAEILLSNLPSKYLTEIARYYGLKNRIFLSWIKSIRDVRNTAAHHSRLWNKTTRVTPIIPKELVSKLGVMENDEYTKKFYGHAIVLYSLLRKIARNTRWALRLRDLVEDNNVERIDITKEMGFPYDWYENEFWR